MAKRAAREGSLSSVDELYRKPVGPNRPDSLYRRLLQFLTWRRERQFSEKR